jgi:hypothetical protein
MAEGPSKVDTEEGRRADAAEQELREASARAKDAEEAASAHRQAHTDALVANAELQVQLSQALSCTYARVLCGTHNKVHVVLCSPACKHRIVNLHSEPGT